MRKLKLFTHFTLLATTPSLFVYPEYSFLPATPQTVNWLGDWWWSTQKQAVEWVRPTTYDGIMQMLEDLESGELEKRYSPELLERVNEYLATLAKEGVLPNEFNEEVDLEEDSYDLLYGEDSVFELTRYLANSNEYMIVPAVLNGYSRYNIVQCAKISKSWKKTKKFCKKHKKAIIIGAVVVVAVAAVTVAVVVTTSASAASVASSAAGVAGAAGAAASGSGSSELGKSESSGSSTRGSSSSQAVLNTAPNFLTAMEDQVSSFKEHLAEEHFFQSSEAGQGLSIEEIGRVAGTLFAHDRFNHFSQISSYPQLSEELRSISSHSDFALPPGATDNPVKFGHNEIDSRFSSNCGPIFSDPSREVNVDALFYQMRGEKALDFGYYQQAINDLNKAININPISTISYLDRSEAHFRLGNYDKSIKDFHTYTQQVAQELKKYPMNIPEFSIGFIKGVPKGILESGNNILMLCSGAVLHPIQTGEQIWASLNLLSDLARSNEWGIFAEVLAPEVHYLVTQWDNIPSKERGDLAGTAFGKYGADMIVPGALAKAVTKGMRGAQELSAISNSLKTANRTFLMESVAGVESSAKIAEVVQLEQRISGWLGEGTQFVRNKAGDPVFLSKDGLRKVRFDFKRPHPHESPHLHFEHLVKGEWEEISRIYPVDVPHR